MAETSSPSIPQPPPPQPLPSPPTAAQVKAALQTIDSTASNNKDAWRVLSATLLAYDPSVDESLLAIDAVAHEIVGGTDTPASTVPESIVDALWLLLRSDAATDAGETTSSSSATPSSSSAATNAPAPSLARGAVALLQLLRESLPNLRPSIRDAILATLPPEILREGGWIASDQELTKKLRLYNTQAYYKQHRFHLLAEESQGYAKLLGFYIRHPAAAGTAGAGGCDSGASPDGGHENVVSDACRQIMGTFSLDPNRCVDLAIDVMVWQVLSNQPDLVVVGGAGGAGAFAVGVEVRPTLSSSAWVKLNVLLAPWSSLLEGALSTKYLPPLLRFKLQEGKYPNKGGRSAHGAEEEEEHRLRRTSALWRVMVWLTTSGHLSAMEMLQYLPPCTVPTVYQERMTAERNRIRSLSRVRLASSSSSTDAELDGTIVAAAAQRLSNDPVVQWIRAFLQLGQFDPIRPCFERSFWSQLCGLFPHLGVQLLEGGLPPGVVHGTTPSLDVRSPPWATTTVDPVAKEDAAEAMEVEEDGSKAAGTTTTTAAASDLDQLHDLLGIVYESGCLAIVPTTFALLCRWVAAQCDNGSTVADATAAQLLLQRFLLPSLSLFQANPMASQEVWAAVRHFPYQTRYLLYHVWRNGGGEPGETTDKPLWLQEGEAAALKSARYSLKRLSKDTIRDQSRAVAKVCHSHPLVVFTAILGQIESYDNLVGVMVDALRYATPLSLDVLSFCILSRLSVTGGTGESVNRSRLKEDGVNLSQWLQSLESFVGAYYKRYPSVEFRGLLCYLMHRLKDGHVMEIGLLRTLLKASAGWAFADYSPAASLSSSQLEGLSGSAHLKRETMSFGVVEAGNPRASKEVRTVLQSHNIGVSLLILLAQVRHHVVFGASKEASSKRSVKLVAHLVDSCQVLVAVLLDFLTDPSDIAVGEGTAAVEALRQYGLSLPALEKLVSAYGIDYASCWMICRPLKRAAAWRRIQESEESGSGDDSQSMNLENDDQDIWMAAVEGSDNLYRSMLPTSTWAHITTDLFETFFTYSLYDLVYPEEVYVAETGRLEKQIERLQAQQKSPSSLSPTIQHGSAPTPRNDDNEPIRMRQVIARLETDQQTQKHRVAAVRRFIASNKAKYFFSPLVTKEAASEFFARCVYPRCMQGPAEALYCAAFVSLLHQERTPGFGTLHVLDSLFVTLSRSLFGLTEGEAADASLLLLQAWKLVSRWRYNESDFEDELAGTPGSHMSANGADPEAVSHSAYCTLYNKWHAELGAVALGCLNSPQYIHRRNCLIVLTRLVESFPTRPGLANKLLAALEPLQDESNALADIRASAQAYGKQLERARDDGVWKEESAADVRARHEKEQSAAAARQEQAKRVMEEIGREAAQISEQIGDPQRRPSDRRRLEPRPIAGDAAVSSTVAPPVGGAPVTRQLGSGITFEPPSAVREGPASRRERDASLEDRRPLSSSADGPPAVSAPSGSSYAALDARPGKSAGERGRTSSVAPPPRDDGVRGGGGPSGGRSSNVEDRWQPRGSGGGDRDRELPDRGRKRSRPPSPAEEGEATSFRDHRDDARPSSKRFGGASTAATAPDSGDEGGGGAGNRRKKARRGRG